MTNNLSFPPLVLRHIRMAYHHFIFYSKKNIQCIKGGNKKQIIEKDECTKNIKIVIVLIIAKHET